MCTEKCFESIHLSSTGKGFSLKLKCKVVQEVCLNYCNKTWLMKIECEDKVKLHRNEIINELEPASLVIELFRAC